MGALSLWSLSVLLFSNFPNSLLAELLCFSLELQSLERATHNSIELHLDLSLFWNWNLEPGPLFVLDRTFELLQRWYLQIGGFQIQRLIG